MQLQRTEAPHVCDKIIASLAIDLALSHCGLSSLARFIILKVKLKDLEDLQLEVDVARRLAIREYLLNFTLIVCYSCLLARTTHSRDTHRSSD
jgi:hypothetical protein